jgi:AcrR family transcriptional regulator
LAPRYHWKTENATFGNAAMCHSLNQGKPMIETEVHPRERILRAAADILAAEGREAVSTRSVSAAAGVQPPTIYRHFGDMRHLVDAAASLGMATYLNAKRRKLRTADPVADLRRGWNLHVQFGIENPHVYTVLYGDPRPESKPDGVAAGDKILLNLMHRIGEQGRLRVGVERAAAMMHSGCRGVALTLIATPLADRDSRLSEATREALIAAVTTAGPDHFTGSAVASRAIALQSVLDKAPPTALTVAEAGLLREWLNRLGADTEPRKGKPTIT